MELSTSVLVTLGTIWVGWMGILHCLLDPLPYPLGTWNPIGAPLCSPVGWISTVGATPRIYRELLQHATLSIPKGTIPGQDPFKFPRPEYSSLVIVHCAWYQKGSIHDTCTIYGRHIRFTWFKWVHIHIIIYAYVYPHRNQMQKSQCPPPQRRLRDRPSMLRGCSVFQPHEPWHEEAISRAACWPRRSQCRAENCSQGPRASEPIDHRFYEADFHGIVNSQISNAQIVDGILHEMFHGIWIGCFMEFSWDFHVGF